MKTIKHLSLSGIVLSGLLAVSTSAQPPIMAPSINLQPNVPVRAHTMKGDAREVRDQSRQQAPPPAPASNQSTPSNPSQGAAAPPIHRSAADGRVDSVRQAVQDDPQAVRAKDASGFTALHYAASGGHADVLAILLDGGAKIDAIGSRGETAILLAAGAGKTEVVELLVSRGADLNRAASDGKTPLIKAATGGYYEVVKALLEGGADPSLKDRSGRTPLAAAEHFRQGEADKVIRLLQSAK